MINPYWDEIKDRLNEVVDGLNTSIGLPPRKLLYSQAIAGTSAHGTSFFGSVVDSTAIDLYRESFDPDTFMRTYHETLWYRRNEFCWKYCWAIPDPVTVDFLVQWSGRSVVEMGAGTGYWAWQLAQYDVPVQAYDLLPPHLFTANPYHSPYDEHHEFIGQTRDVYHPIEVGNPSALERHGERTLFVCWPPMSEMATECLQCYPGNRLLYIGEWDGGCNASEDFFTLLGEEWHEVASHDPIQWDGIHDVVYVFERGKDLEQLEATL